MIIIDNVHQCNDMSAAAFRSSLAAELQDCAQLHVQGNGFTLDGCTPLQQLAQAVAACHGLG